MIEYSVYRLLSETAHEALGTMFFAEPDTISSSAARPGGDLVSCSLTFRGAPCGRFNALVSAPLAHSLAANFFGVEADCHLAPGQVLEMIGELTNIICGAVLSELECSSNFDLSTPAPVVIPANEPGPDFNTGHPVSCRLDMPQGAVVLHLAFEESE